MIVPILCLLCTLAGLGIALFRREWATSPRGTKLCAALVLLGAAALRLHDLEHIPNGLFRDEVEKGYSAWTLAHEGGVLEFARDPAHPFAFRLLPLHINVAGSTTSAIYQYLSIPFVLLGGPTAGATRTAAALAGIAAVLLLGLLAGKAWGPAAGIPAMALLAVSPWHLVFSRWAAQGIFVPLAMTGVLAGLLGAERRRLWGFPLGGLSLGAVYYVYSGAQPFALLWGAVLCVQYRREIREQWQDAAVGFGLFLLGALPAAWLTFLGGGDGRLNAVAVWNAPDATPMLTAWRISTSWAAHFNPLFLFARGDALPRHAIPHLGQLLAVDLLLLPVGIWFSVRERRPLWRALLSAFLAGPIGAAITWGHIPHALRALPMVLPAAMWSALALVRLTEAGAGARRMILRGGVFALFALNALLACGAYFRTFAQAPEALAAFEHSYVRAFGSAARGRTLTEKVWVDGRLPYAPYFAAFFGQIPARVVAGEGLESRGWVFYDGSKPETARLESLMHDGDWIIALNREAEAVLYRRKPGGLEPVENDE